MPFLIQCALELFGRQRSHLKKKNANNDEQGNHVGRRGIRVSDVRFGNHTK